MVAVYLAAHYAPPGTIVHIDCKGVITSVQQGGPRVMLGEMVSFIRQWVKRKGLSLRHVKAHVGIPGNEVANTTAQTCNASVKFSPKQVPTNAFHVVFKGEKFTYPHKVWTKTLLPKHQQSDIWHVSFWPLRYRFQTWIKWIYACKWVPGYEGYHSFWNPPGSPGFSKHANLCGRCGSSHNQSVHGYIAFCDQTHPLVQAWIQSWPSSVQQRITQWRANANQRDRFILGKLCIPASLRITFKDWHLKFREVRAIIRKFQQIVTVKMKSLPPINATWKAKRPNPWDKDDWKRELKLTIHNPFSHR